MDIEPLLVKFLERAKTDKLATSDFPDRFGDLTLKVSFGKGNQAHIPWLAIYNEARDTVSNGIYPVYLYFKSHNILILAYGLSETNIPEHSWSLKNPITIKEHFAQHKLSKPHRYDKSIVFKVYEPENIMGYDLNEDLNQILDSYFQTFNNPPDTNEHKKVSFNHIKFHTALQRSGLLYSRSISMRFTSSLATKPFVILTGLSGSGKTKLAQAFGQWITESEDQYCIVPIGADWTNREPLLGFPNALKEKEYVKPENGVLDLILRALQNLDMPYFLILDEMNLSQVERYFADFLSAMESGEDIPLHSGEYDWNGVPSSIKLPKNLFIIGTVNIDETTNMFSPKVLDRANTIEFRVSKNEIADFLANNKPLDMKSIEGQGAGMAASFLQLALRKQFDDNKISFLNEPLLQFFEELSKTGAEFGYRSASEIKRLVHQLTIIDSENELSEDEKLDIAVMQKLLPKLHGSRKKLIPALKALGGLCVTEQITDIQKEILEDKSFAFSSNSNVRFPLSLEKVTRMYRGAIDNGYASYAEA